jgi:hypothetical protein
MVFCFRWIQNSERGNRPNPRSTLILTCLAPFVLWSIRTIMEAITERKTAVHVMMQWKYKPLDQNDALWPWVGLSIKGGNTTAGKGGPGKKQTVFWWWDREGWQSREIKLKELKHEGHIALGKWNSPWSQMHPYVGWTLLFASVTCLQGYIRWDPFVLRAQPLDMSPLSLCQHNKTFPANLPQHPLSQLIISHNGRRITPISAFIFTAFSLVWMSAPKLPLLVMTPITLD